jgi:hypothetical protein
LRSHRSARFSTIYAGRGWFRQHDFAPTQVLAS